MHVLNSKNSYDIMNSAARMIQGEVLNVCFNFNFK